MLKLKFHPPSLLVAVVSFLAVTAGSAEMARDSGLLSYLTATSAGNPSPGPTGLSPDGIFLPNTSTQATLSWPAVSNSDSYQIFVNDLSEPATRMEGSACPKDERYYCGIVSGSSVTIQVTPGRNYEWWVKAIDSQGVEINERSAKFGVARPQNQLYVRVSRSYMQAGENYYLYAYAANHPTGMTFSGYSGLLDVLAWNCQPNNPGVCATPRVFPWGSYTLSNGSVRVDLPADFPTGIYKAKFRPWGQTSWQWSNSITVNVGARSGLKDMKEYWIMPELLAIFDGINSTSAEPFRTGIGYVPTIECQTQLPVVAGGKTMFFTKDKRAGYWNPLYPNELIGDGTENLKWHLMPWQRQAGWHDTYLRAWGHQSYQYNPSTLAYSGNFQMLYSAYRYDSISGEIPGYVLSPEFVAPGWGIVNSQQLYSNAHGEMVDICSLRFGANAFTGNWVVHIDETSLHLPNYDGPAMRIKFYEGADLTIGPLFREDWYFVENKGLVRIEQKIFSASQVGFEQKIFNASQLSSQNPIMPCGWDPDCMAEFMVKPHTTITLSKYAR